MFEFPPTGGVVHFASATTVNLYRSKDNELFTIVSEVLFFIFELLFFLREAKRIYRKGFSRYLYGFWNKVEISIIASSIAATALYFYRDKLVKELLPRVQDKRPEVFINFQFAASISILYNYLIATVAFLTILKFIKMLRFNNRISLLSRTLRRARNPMSMLSITLLTTIIGLAVVGTVLFGRELYGYRKFSATFTSIIRLLLGKLST